MTRKTFNRFIYISVLQHTHRYCHKMRLPCWS